MAETLIGSEIVRLGGEIKEKIRQGATIYNYTIGDFDSSIFPIPALLRKEIKMAYEEGFTTYPPANGIESLRMAISAFIREKESLDFAPDEVLIGAGGRPLIYAAYRAIVDKDDGVIFPVPSWNNNHYTHFTQGKHIMITAKPENNFMPVAEDIYPHLQEASLLALCSPLNPTGTVFKKEELEKICDMVLAENLRRGADEKKLYVLYDQMYWTLTYGDTLHYTPVGLRPEMKAYTVFIDGISKAFAATGVRVGWALGPRHILSKMNAINSHVGAWSPMAEQQATARFLRQQDQVDLFLDQFKQELSARLQMIYEGFVQLKKEGFDVDACPPEAAIYLTIRLISAGKTTAEGKKLETQADVTDYILNEAHLAVVPFYAFGAPDDSNWYRLSVGACKAEDIPVMLEHLRKALGKLK